MNRRQFIATASATAGAVALSGSLPRSLAAEAAPRGAAATLYVRQNINAFTAAQVADLRAAVSAMMSRPTSDPTSWMFQANIHGTTGANSNPTWSTCQHGSFFFFSWHRMYLYYLERILRAASPSKQLSLPYWAYAPNANRSLPTPYRTPKTGNSLFVEDRNDGINDGVEIGPEFLTWCLAYTRVPFFSPPGQNPTLTFGGGFVPAPVHFASVYGQLERLPHNTVHTQVGGLMGDPDTAAQDPIFWAHHANVDRLWEGWLAQGGGRANPTGDATWMNTPFHFYDENRNPVTLTGAQVLHTATQLGYRYDAMPTTPCPTLASQVREPRIFTAPWLPGPGPNEALARAAGHTLAASGATTIQLAVPAPLRTALVRHDAATTVELRLEGVRVTRNPGVAYHVFANIPAAGAESAARAPTAQARYLGTLDFFEIVSHHHDPAVRQSGYTVAVDVSDAAAALGAGGALQRGTVTLTFVPEGPRRAGARAVARSPVQIGAVVLRVVRTPR
jgi:hypothetical protein